MQLLMYSKAERLPAPHRDLWHQKDVLNLSHVLYITFIRKVEQLANDCLHLLLESGGY